MAVDDPEVAEEVLGMSDVVEICGLIAGIVGDVVITGADATGDVVVTSADVTGDVVVTGADVMEDVVVVEIGKVTLRITLVGTLIRLGGTGSVSTAGTVKSAPGPVVRARLFFEPKILDEFAPHPKAVRYFGRKSWKKSGMWSMTDRHCSCYV